MARDTDLDWSIIAEHHPFFGVLANERFLTPNLTPEAIGDFYATGRGDVAHVVDVLRRVAPKRFAPSVGLDFGCGVGRLTFAMTEHARQVIGVDVAPDMLRIAREQAATQRVRGVEFRDSLPDHGVDWINSLIVFQHIPPERGYGILEGLVQVLNPGGFVSIQISFFRDTRHTAEIVRDLSDYRYDGHTIELINEPTDDHPGSMSMYDYDMNRVLRILYLGGIETVLTEHTDHAGCHGAWLFGRRAP
jgi:SAM-dependent methyltransferase